MNKSTTKKTKTPKPPPYRHPEAVVSEFIVWYLQEEKRLPSILELKRDAKLSYRTAARWRSIALQRRNEAKKPSEQDLSKNF